MDTYRGDQPSLLRERPTEGHPNIRAGLFVDEFFFAPGLSGRTRSRTTVKASVAAGLAVTLLAVMFVLRMGGGAEGMAFRYAFATGQKHTYDMSITMTAVPAGVAGAQPFDGTITARLSYEVVSTQPDGTSVVDLTMSDVRSEPNTGGTIPDGSTLRVTVGPDGRVSKVEGSGGVFGAAGASMSSFSSLPGSPSDSAGSQFLFPEYPDERIAPGDTWSEESSVPLPIGDNTVTVKTKGRHDGFEQSKSVRVARFHHSIESPLDLSFTFGELFEAMGDLGEQAASEAPPGAENAVMKIVGNLSMDADSIVVPGSNELVRLDGTAKMTMRMKMENIPAGEGAPPGDFAFDATMRISMIRVDVGADPS